MKNRTISLKYKNAAEELEADITDNTSETSNT